jgi:hypothetical protein
MLTDMFNYQKNTIVFQETSGFLMQHEVLWGHVCAALIDGNTHGCDLGATGLSIGHVFVPKKDFRPNVSGMWKKSK